MSLPGNLLGNIKRIVERFCDQNAVVNSLDLELHDRTREDGECLGAISRNESRPRSIVVDVFESDQLSEPFAVSDCDFNDYLQRQYGIDCSQFVPSWKFGVLTTQRRTWRPLGYHVKYDSAGTDWDFYPPSNFFHMKRNVKRNVKRGLSDWHAPRDAILSHSKLSKNMAAGAALQSAIAWIEESPAGTTPEQLANISTVVS